MDKEVSLQSKTHKLLNDIALIDYLRLYVRLAYNDKLEMKVNTKVYKTLVELIEQTITGFLIANDLWREIKGRIKDSPKIYQLLKEQIKVVDQFIREARIELKEVKATFLIDSEDKKLENIACKIDNYFLPLIDKLIVKRKDVEDTIAQIKKRLIEEGMYY